MRAVLALAVGGALSFAAWAVSAAPPLEAYGKLPALELLSLSPSGQLYAMIAVAGDHRDLIVAKIDNEPIYATPLGEAKVRTIDWAGENHLLITISSTVTLGMDFAVDRQELNQTFALSLPAKALIPIFKAGTRTEPITLGYYGAVDIKGRWFGYFGGITLEESGTGERFLGHTYADLYRVDLDTGDIQRAADGSENLDDWFVGPDGAVVARSSYDQTSGLWRVYRGSHGGAILASGKNPYGGATLSGFGRKPDTILLRVPGAHGSEDEEVPLAGGPAVEAPDDEAIDGVVLDRLTKTWIGYTGFGDVPELKMFDPVVSARVRATRRAFPDQSVRFDSWSNDFSRLIVFTSGGDDSGTYWQVEIAKGSAKPIGREYPEIQPEDVGPIRMVDWKASDGLALHGVLSLPPGRLAHDLPLIVMPHGGPESRDYPVFDWWAQAFASRGYAVFQPNFRGSTQVGEAVYEAGLGEYGRKMQTDIVEGVAELARQGIIDPKRTCIVGASFGGYAALMGVTVRHDGYRCSVSVAGLSSLSGFANYVGDEAGAESADHRSLRAFMGKGDLGMISPLKFARADGDLIESLDSQIS